MAKIVIALGGNALIKKGESPTAQTQIKNIKRALDKLFPLIRDNEVVLTHGSGPQAGYLLLQQELAKSKVASMPLDVLDAETEGQIGYLIQQNLQNIFNKKRVKRNIVTVLTQVLVDKNDKAFKNPTKFIGPYYSRNEADRLKKFNLKEDSGKGYRRVVASPKPLEIIESRVISDLLEKNTVVIAAGGGGIPVVKKKGSLEGIEAVIDKDLASASLAESINADLFIMVTDVDSVYINYKKKNQKRISRTTLNEIKSYYHDGQFPAGSMGPKIEAAMNFLSKRKGKVIITDINNIDKADKKGTVIER